MGRRACLALLLASSACTTVVVQAPGTDDAGAPPGSVQGAPDGGGVPDAPAGLQDAPGTDVAQPAGDAGADAPGDAGPGNGASSSPEAAAAGYTPWQDGDPAVLYPYTYADRRPDGWVDVVFSAAPQGKVAGTPSLVLEFGPPVAGGPPRYTLVGSYLKTHPECPTEGALEQGQALASHASGVDVTFAHATGHYGVVAFGSHGALQVSFDQATVQLSAQGICQ